MSMATWRRLITMELDENHYQYSFLYPSLKYAQVCKKGREELLKSSNVSYLEIQTKLWSPLVLIPVARSTQQRLNLTIRNPHDRVDRRALRSKPSKDSSSALANLGLLSGLPSKSISMHAFLCNFNSSSKRPVLFSFMPQRNCIKQ